MSERVTTAAAVREYLKEREPLSVLTLDDLYQIETPGTRAAVRAALYYYTLGTPVSDRGKPRELYAIRLELPLGAPSSPVKELFLSLPGVPRELLEHDASSEQTDQIKRLMAARLSSEVVNYWLSAAQYRSVDLIQKNMKKAREQSKGVCRLCRTVNHLRLEMGLPPLPEVKNNRACHVISRNTVFWMTVEEVSRNHDLFSAQGVCALTSALKNNEYHSSARFMIGLCKTHDSLLQKVLKQHIIRNKQN